MDDRGYYIFITKDELQNLSSLLKTKGRISKTALTLEANKLIRLAPTASDQTQIEHDKRKGFADMEAAMEEELKRG